MLGAGRGGFDYYVRNYTEESAASECCGAVLILSFETKLRPMEHQILIIPRQSDNTHIVQNQQHHQYYDCALLTQFAQQA